MKHPYWSHQATRSHIPPSLTPNGEVTDGLCYVARPFGDFVKDTSKGPCVFNMPNYVLWKMYVKASDAGMTCLLEPHAAEKVKPAAWKWAQVSQSGSFTHRCDLSSLFMTIALLDCPWASSSQNSLLFRLLYTLNECKFGNFSKAACKCQSAHSD